MTQSSARHVDGEEHAHFDPASYDDEVRAQIPVYDEFQEHVGATPGDRVGRVLDLGTGTGTTASVVVRHHSEASLVLLDESADMLAVATASLPAEDPADAVIDLTPDHDRPDRLDDLLAWLGAAGFLTSVVWARNDLAVVRAVASPA